MPSADKIGGSGGNARCCAVADKPQLTISQTAIAAQNRALPTPVSAAEQLPSITVSNPLKSRRWIWDQHRVQPSLPRGRRGRGETPNPVLGEPRRLFRGMVTCGYSAIRGPRAKSPGEYSPRFRGSQKRESKKRAASSPLPAKPRLTGSLFSAGARDDARPAAAVTHHRRSSYDGRLPEPIRDEESDFSGGNESPEHANFAVPAAICRKHCVHALPPSGRGRTFRRPRSRQLPNPCKLR